MTRLSAKARGLGHGNVGSLKRRFITFELIKKLMAEVEDPTDRDKKPAARRIRKRLDIMLDKLCELAMGGDLQAIKLVFDRIEGSAVQTMNFRMQDVVDGEETPEQVAALMVTRDKIAAMSPDERIRLYRTSLSEASRTEGSA